MISFFAFYNAMPRLSNELLAFVESENETPEFNQIAVPEMICPGSLARNAFQIIGRIAHSTTSYI